jgi:phenylacetate-coenzyme A ligase PaaK-like adenylate-forming protein
MRLKAEAIVGVPGYVYHLLRVARQEGYQIPDVRTVVLGGERVAPGLRAKLRVVLEELGAKDVSILPTYGFTEARMALGQCPAKDGTQTGYHLYPDLGIFEVVDPQTGEVRQAGEDGELVFSALDGRGSCVLRYRTGDLVKGGIHTDPCPNCGRKVPRIANEITRTSSVKDLRLMKIKGTLVNLEDFGHVLSSVPEVEEWQVELAKKDNDPLEVDELVLYVALKEGADRETCAERLRQMMRSSIEVAPNRMHFLRLDEMLVKVGMETEMKERRFVDSRPGS